VFVELSGSYLVWITLAINWEISKFGINQFCRLHFRNRNARIVGSKVYEEDYKGLIIYELKKLFLENYLDVVLINVLQVYGWINYPGSNFWDNIWRVLS
jgi:hypothetical protein